LNGSSSPPLRTSKPKITPSTSDIHYFLIFLKATSPFETSPKIRLRSHYARAN
jgi:hypothetical protein